MVGCTQLPQCINVSLSNDRNILQRSITLTYASFVEKGEDMPKILNLP